MATVHEPIREAVGVFQNMDEMQNAIRKLENTAFARQDISIQGHPWEIQKQFGAPAVQPEKLEDNPDAPRQPPVRPEEQTIGGSALVGGFAYLGTIVSLLAWKPATILDAMDAILTGVSVGALIGFILLEMAVWYYNRHVEAQIGKGGLVLWVRTPDKMREDAACDIMRAYGATHIRVHEMDS